MANSVSNELSLLTGGLIGNNGRSLVSLGLSAFFRPMPACPRDTVKVITKDRIQDAINRGRVLMVDKLPDNASIIRDVTGKPVERSVFSQIDLGDGQVLFFDASLQGRISPAPVLKQGTLNILDDGLSSFTGSDVRVAIEIAEPTDGMPRCSKQLLELTTLTVSVHRVKSPVRAIGFINPVGHTRGGRTIAGTMVMTKFTTDVLYRFLQSGFIKDKSKDLIHMKVDQLPSFNLTILFGDEWGHAAYQRLLRVEFVTDGSVYSIQDMLTEQTVSYVAADFTPLLPLDISSFYSPAKNDPTVSRQKTPGDLALRC